MANVDRPHGFTPLKHITGAPFNAQGNLYNIASDYGTAIGVGDIVKLAGSADTRGVPTVAKAGATDLPVGVVLGRIPNPDNLSLTYVPASVGGYVMVCDDPDIIMIAQEDGTLTADDIGLNTKPTVTGVNTSTGISTEEIDFSEAGSTNTLMLKILRLYDIEDNAIGANAECECRFNVHALRLETGATAT